MQWLAHRLTKVRLQRDQVESEFNAAVRDKDAWKSVDFRIAPAALAPRLAVTRSGVGTDVADQQLVGQSDMFAVGTRVAFWTHVTGGRPGDTVRHVWSHDGRTASAVDLPVGSPSWRTQSRRTLAAGAEGTWVVEARDPEGRVLARHEFRCAR